MSKRLWLFDMDDTAIELGSYDFPSVFGQTLNGETGKDYSRNDVYNVFGIFDMDYKESIGRMCREVGVNDHNSFFDRLEANDYDGRLPLVGNEIHMKDDVRDCLENLRRDDRNRIVLFTMAPDRITNMQLKKLEAEDLFHGIRCSQYFTPDSKPRPNTIIHFMKKYGISPENSRIVGDMRFDMMAGKAAGIKTGLKVSDNGHYDGPEPDMKDACLVRLVDKMKETRDEMQVR